MAATETQKTQAALKMAEALNDIFGPALRAYIAHMQELTKIAGRPLYSALPGGPVINLGPLPRHAEAPPELVIGDQPHAE